MIDLKQLVAAIHGSVTGAAASLRAQNLEILDQFFETTGDPDDLEHLASQLASASSDLSEAEDPSSAADSLRIALDSLREAASIVRGQTSPDRPGALVPKMVVMQYPMETAEGPVVHPVTVPLITLASMSSLQLSSLRFKTELEIELVDDVLQVSFPSQSPPPFEDPSTESPHRASLEIEIEACKPPRGLEILVEGYERALRAQIPG